MKYYILFYLFLFVFISGGSWVSSKYLKRSREKRISNINHHDVLSDILSKGSEVSTSETKGKYLVLYGLNITNNYEKDDFKKLVEINELYAKTSCIFLFSTENIDYIKDKFRNQPDIFKLKILADQQTVDLYLRSLIGNYYPYSYVKKYSHSQSIFTIINSNGKIILYKIAPIGDMKQIKSILKSNL